MTKYALQVIIVLAAWVLYHITFNNHTTLELDCDHACLETNYNSSVLRMQIKHARDTHSQFLCSDLWPITKSNAHLTWNDEQVLMVSWASNTTYHKYYRKACQENTSVTIPRIGTLWLTPFPQVKLFAQDFSRANSSVSLSTRLKQYIGLPPNGTYDVFIEFWVNPSDLLRPCIDTEIHDNACLLDDSHEDNSLFHALPDDYKNFFQNQKSSHYPFTRLGYTWDWAHGGTIGSSEYVVDANSTLQVHRAIWTDQYPFEEEIWCV